MQLREKKNNNFFPSDYHFFFAVQTCFNLILKLFEISKLINTALTFEFKCDTISRDLCLNNPLQYFFHLNFFIFPT